MFWSASLQNLSQVDFCSYYFISLMSCAVNQIEQQHFTYVSNRQIFFIGNLKGKEEYMELSDLYFDLGIYFLMLNNTKKENRNDYLMLCSVYDHSHNSRTIAFLVINTFNLIYTYGISVTKFCVLKPFNFVWWIWSWNPVLNKKMLLCYISYLWNINVRI